MSDRKTDDYVPFPHTFFGHLFQAGMWRDYAQAWNRDNSPRRIGRQWMASVMPVPRAECLRRARIHAQCARTVREEDSTNER